MLKMDMQVIVRRRIVQEYDYFTFFEAVLLRNRLHRLVLYRLQHREVIRVQISNRLDGFIVGQD